MQEVKPRAMDSHSQGAGLSSDLKQQQQKQQQQQQKLMIHVQQHFRFTMDCL